MHNAHIINYLPISQFIMVFNWKKIKEILIQRKGLGTVASRFWDFVIDGASFWAPRGELPGQI